MRFIPRPAAERANVSPGSPLVELVQLVVGGVLVVIALVWLAGLATDMVAARISPEAERTLFGPLVDQVRIEAPEDAERLERVFAPFNSGQPAPVLGVLEEPQLNAFALPGGVILVTRGLLDEVDDDELAFVLAHELAHLEQRDNLRALGRGAALGVVLSMIGIQAGASPLDLAGATSRLSLARFSRGRERAADAIAVRRLLARGGNATAAIRLLERLRALEGRGDRLLAWALTHPLGEERIADARELVAGVR